MLRSPFTNRRKMNFFIKILILFTLATSIARSQTQQSEAEQLFNQFKRAARFDYTYPREKVYVHLDNLGYLVEDTIWYKAYVVRASSLKPTNLSRVLYVELLNADGQQVIQNIHKLDNMGTAQGMFSLQKPVYAGYYEIRAYTREMVNWKTEACFSRVIPVFTNSNPNKKVENEELTDITQLSIPQPSPHKGTTIANPRPYEMKEITNILTGLKDSVEETGVELYDTRNIQYGIKLMFRTHQLRAELNLFYGHRGFSVVESPKRGTSMQLNSLMAQLVGDYINGINA